MDQTLRRFHLIQAALQTKGATMERINLLLAALRRIKGFEEWNQQLDQEELAMLTALLDPRGRALGDILLEEFFTTITRGHNITAAELRALAGLN